MLHPCPLPAPWVSAFYVRQQSSVRLCLQNDRTAARRKPLVSLAKDIISQYFKVVRCGTGANTMPDMAGGSSLPAPCILQAVLREAHAVSLPSERRCLLLHSSGVPCRRVVSDASMAAVATAACLHLAGADKDFRVTAPSLIFPDAWGADLVMQVSSFAAATRLQP